MSWRGDGGLVLVVAAAAVSFEIYKAGYRSRYHTKVSN